MVSRRGGGLKSLTNERYEMFVALLKGEFKVPVCERTSSQKAGLIQFWRNHKYLGLRKVNNTDYILYKGQKLLRRQEFSDKVSGEFKKKFTSGVRSIFHKMRSKYAGTSERMIAKSLRTSKQYNRSQAKFTNKPPLIPVSSKTCFERIQIDILDMRKESIQSKGKQYRYILSVIDCFSRFIFLRPLVNKSAKEVKRHLESIFLEHGKPKIIQCDNGPEFKGEVKEICKKQNIQIINSRPYHPQSQGKIERSNRTVKLKLRYLSQRKSGYNWVDYLPKVASVINSEPKEVLAYSTPFQVYYGRVKDSVDEVRRRALDSMKRCSTRMVLSHGKGHGCSVYNKNERILLRYPFKKERVPRKRYVLLAKIKKRNKTLSRYKVSYTDPKNVTKTEWVSVEYITSLTLKEESERRARSKNIIRNKLNSIEHRKKYYIPLTNSISTDDDSDSSITHKPTDESVSRPNDFIDGVRIEFDPEKCGNCQFDAVRHQLSQFGIYRSSHQLRQSAVSHISENAEGYSEFVPNFGLYLLRMSRDSTYGDHLTLQALSREFNVQFLVLSTLGLEHHRIISNTGKYDEDLPVLTLGHYPEGDGEHYVSVRIEQGQTSQYLCFVNSNFENNDSVRFSSPSQTSTDESVSRPNDFIDGVRIEFDPEKCGNCQFDAVRHQLSQFGLYRSSQQLRQCAVSHISENAESYSEFVPNFRIYLLRMSRDSTYGDHLTLQALSREFNVQFLVLSTLGLEHHRIISNTGKYDEDLPMLTLGHYPEGDDEHYVSVRIEQGQTSQYIPPSPTCISEDDSQKTPTPIVTQEPLSSQNVDIDNAAQVNLIDLPILILDRIVQMSISIDPFSMFTLQNVCRYLWDIVRRIGYPQIYINRDFPSTYAFPISVRRMLNDFGRNSGTVLRLREIVQHPRWNHAWIVLRHLDLGWFEVIDVFWRRQL